MPLPLLLLLLLLLKTDAFRAAEMCGLLEFIHSSSAIYFACVNFFLFSWSLGEQLYHDQLDRFSQSLHRMKAFWLQMIDLHLFIWYLKRCFRDNQIMLEESNERGLILHLLFALAYLNELEYRYLYVRKNSSDNQATSDINLVCFWPVPSEFTQIKCEEQASFNSWVFIYVRQVIARLCFATTCYGTTLRRRAGYALGFATHF